MPAPVDIETTITPTINADGTITAVMLPRLVWVENLPGVRTQQIQTVANITDGDTIALGGLRDSRGGYLVMFVTARIVPSPKQQRN